VNFENTVIIMTTNAGSDKKDGSVGFNRSINEQGKEKAIKALNDFLRRNLSTGLMKSYTSTN
jgi:ATP-dependent Clp protease ATP-binding subunit ClpA